MRNYSAWRIRSLVRGKQERSQEGSPSVSYSWMLRKEIKELISRRMTGWKQSAGQVRTILELSAVQKSSLRLYLRGFSLHCEWDKVKGIAGYFWGGRTSDTLSNQKLIWAFWRTSHVSALGEIVKMSRKTTCSQALMVGCHPGFLLCLIPIRLWPHPN